MFARTIAIPLPDSLKKYDKLMHSVGMGKYADELVPTMNRAAEAAVPEAKKLFVDSIKKMSVQDAKGILTGGQTSGTDYFKRQANLDDYVTQKALDGLFFMVAEEEKKIRQDPVKAGSDIIRKVFGALK